MDEEGVSVYVTGDTSKTEQMPLLAEKEIDYAFYCCDGVFNMGLDEAAECAELVRAKHSIPYHVLAQDGVYYDRERAELFNAENMKNALSQILSGKADAYTVFLKIQTTANEKWQTLYD